VRIEGGEAGEGDGGVGVLDKLGGAGGYEANGRTVVSRRIRSRDSDWLCWDLCLWGCWSKSLILVWLLRDLVAWVIVQRLWNGMDVCSLRLIAGSICFRTRIVLCRERRLRRSLI